MNIIKDIKSWLTKDETGGTTVNIEVFLTCLDYQLQYKLYEAISSEVSKIVAETFIKENGETIKRQILENPDFANSVYNAIVLKKADKI